MQCIGLLCHLIYSTTPPPPKKKCPTPSKFLTLLNKHNPIHPGYNNLRSTTPPPPQYFNFPLTIYSQPHPLPPQKISLLTKMTFLPPQITNLHRATSQKTTPCTIPQLSPLSPKKVSKTWQ